MEYKRNDIVLLNNNKHVRIIDIPGSFMSNNSFLVTEVININNKFNDIGKNFWVKSGDFFSKVNLDFHDDIDKYIATIFDQQGIHLIPKNLESVEIINSDNEFIEILIKMGNNDKHKEIRILFPSTFLVKEPVVIKPKKTLITKITEIFKKEKDE